MEAYVGIDDSKASMEKSSEVQMYTHPPVRRTAKERCYRAMEQSIQPRRNPIRARFLHAPDAVLYWVHERRTSWRMLFAQVLRKETYSTSRPVAVCGHRIVDVLYFDSLGSRCCQHRSTWRECVSGTVVRAIVITVYVSIINSKRHCAPRR